jgi:restriction system protein
VIGLQTAGGINSKVVWIDGPTLAKLMVDHHVGVAPMRSYDVSRIDSDYFTEE